MKSYKRLTFNSMILLFHSFLTRCVNDNLHKKKKKKKKNCVEDVRIRRCEVSM